MRKHRRLRRKRNKKQTHLVIGMTLALLFVFTAGYAAFGTNISITAKGNLTTEETCTLNHEWTYDYENNKIYDLKIPCTGTYKIELWGAQGGGSNNNEGLGGTGAYTSGLINLKRTNILYVYVGSEGDTDIEYNHNTTYKGGYNGGGASGSNQWASFGSGGGATDIRLTNGNWNDFTSLKSRIMVAAGGAGSGYWTSYGYMYAGIAGELQGYEGEQGFVEISSLPNRIVANTIGATQTAGGINNKGQITGKFGYASDGNGSAGGGGGYYGGAAGSDQGYSPSAGSGGSSFVSGHDGCDAIDKNSTENNIIHTGQSIHYSGYKFADTVMIDGAGCKWTNAITSNCSGMPTHDGTGTMTGNSGNGYAKITLVSIG